jgi:plastocyanin
MRIRQSVVLLSGALALAALAAGCGAQPGGAAASTPPAAASTPPAEKADKPDKPAKPAPQQVVIDNFTYDPPELTVPVGTEVVWVNRDDVPHTATSTGKPKAFDSGALDTEAKFSRVFDKPGTYEYFCAVHPKMTGRIIVK